MPASDVSQEMPTYQEVSQFLCGHSIARCASETHGMVCGFICAGQKMAGNNALSFMLDAEDGVQRSLLLQLYASSYQQIQNMAFDFRMLLPNDDAPLPQRAKALGAWCDGFIMGLKLAGVAPEKQGVEDVQDLVFHIEEIAKIDHVNLDITDADERAFVEVHEYVRMGVLMMYCELVLKQKLPDAVAPNKHLISETVH